jgi:hypothetical protein
VLRSKPWRARSMSGCTRRRPPRWKSSEAVRTALRQAAARRRLRSTLRGEVRALAEDHDDREETRAVREQLADLAPVTQRGWCEVRCSVSPPLGPRADASSEAPAMRSWCRPTSSSTSPSSSLRPPRERVRGQLSSGHQAGGYGDQGSGRVDDRWSTPSASPVQPGALMPRGCGP